MIPSTNILMNKPKRLKDLTQPFATATKKLNMKKKMKKMSASKKK